jgi:Na+/citrate or Na+/malate symporter
MKPMFVDVRRGEKDVHWIKFLVFAISVIVIGVVLGMLADYLILGRYAFGAPMAGGTIGVLIVVRLLIRIVGYQPIEVESDMEAG